MGTTAFIVLLVLAGLVLVLFELLTPPPYGPLAVLAIAALVGAIWLAFTVSTGAGIILTAGLAVVVPAYVALLVRIMPRLPGVRKLFLEKVASATATATPDAPALESMIGRIGTAETLLRPSGAVRIEGRRVVGVAESGLIEKGATVKVIGASGTDVIVRQVAESPSGQGANG